MKRATIRVLSVSLTTMAVVGAFAPTSMTKGSIQASTTNLEMAKNSERAHIERNLEEMMGNDWRLFRAKLVAKEQAEEQTRQQRKQRRRSSKKKSTGKKEDAETETMNKDETVEDDVDVTEDDEFMGDEKLAHQGQLGDLFAGAISSIFKGNKKNRNSKSEGSDTDIFDGVSIGGLDELLGEDPFVSEAELPLLVRSPSVSLDKHRWAHEIPHVEAGCVLLANEKLGGVFHQTVVLIVQHDDKAGSIGIVINRPLDGNLLKVASETNSNLDLSLKLAFTRSPVTYGGPVLPEEFSVIHGFGQVEGSTKLCPGVFVGGSEELMNEVRINRFRPEQALFVKGHAAWVPGQLSREINKGVWYTAAASAGLILKYAQPVEGAEQKTADGEDVVNNSHKDLWADIMDALGGKYAEIAQNYGGRGGRRMP